MDEVEEFINRFKSNYKNELEDLFLNNLCYYFAVILKDKFKNSTILYDYENVHFLTMINDNLYDIRGKVTNLYENYEGLVMLDDMEISQSYDYPLIKNVCIDLR